MDELMGVDTKMRISCFSYSAQQGAVIAKEALCNLLDNMTQHPVEASQLLSLAI